jgi:hypothetical protein
MTLNIVAGSSVVDIENGSENGEVTPIISPQNDFVDYDDNFETASDGEDDDDDDSIEVIVDGEDDVSVNKLKSNKPESVKLPSKSLSGQNLQDCIRGSDVVVEVIGIYGNTGVDVCNEENKLERGSEGYGKDKNCGSDGKCFEWKEAESLGVTKFDGSEELSGIPGSADFMDEDNLDHADEVMLVTSTPATGKRQARKGMARDFDNKGEAGTLKKFVDGSYIGFGRHRDGSNLGKIKTGLSFLL